MCGIILATEAGYYYKVFINSKSKKAKRVKSTQMSAFPYDTLMLLLVKKVFVTKKYGQLNR
jgi:hypothetical protein